MNHIFITRLAVVLGGKASITKTKNKLYDSPVDRIRDVIEYWFNHASKFYTQQTVDHNFKVYLVYSDRYRDVVKSYAYPEWCVLTRDKRVDTVRENISGYYYNDSLSVTRIDADDWYSNDYFEYLAQDHEITDMDNMNTTHLHKRVHLFNRTNLLISQPQQFSSPGFASVTFKKLDRSKLPINLKLWPHGSIKHRKHLTPSEIYGMQSVGCNVVNKWRVSSKPAPGRHEIMKRFYTPKFLNNLL